MSDYLKDLEKGCGKHNTIPTSYEGIYDNCNEDKLCSECKIRINDYNQGCKDTTEKFVMSLNKRYNEKQEDTFSHMEILRIIKELSGEKP
jgi:hypothetical protein